MVVFTCGQCNESLKKNQVEKHYLSRCRNCNVLACVDCGKDFFGDSYKEHIKCISEEEKYSGKNYKPKPNANKGEVKQEQWLQKVQTAIDNCVANKNLKNVLERMKDYPNIPRKKAKFENFVSNSMNVRDRRLVAEVWDILLANTDQQTPQTETTNNENGNETQETSEETNKQDKLKEMTKEERKAERKRVKKKEKNKEGQKDIATENTNGSTEKDKKKSKKRKRKNEEEEDDETQTKKQHIEESEADTTITEEDGTDQRQNGGSSKFNWEETITDVLKSKGEISLKKLKKKVLAEYTAQGGKPKGEERLHAKLNKKINKNPTFVVKKEKVKLKKYK